MLEHGPSRAPGLLRPIYWDKRRHRPGLAVAVDLHAAGAMRGPAASTAGSKERSASDERDAERSGQGSMAPPFAGSARLATCFEGLESYGAPSSEEAREQACWHARLCGTRETSAEGSGMSSPNCKPTNCHAPAGAAGGGGHRSGWGGVRTMAERCLEGAAPTLWSAVPFLAVLTRGPTNLHQSTQLGKTMRGTGVRQWRFVLLFGVRQVVPVTQPVTAERPSS